MTGPQEVLLKCSPGDIVILKYVYGKFLLPLYTLCSSASSATVESTSPCCYCVTGVTREPTPTAAR